MKNNHLVFNQSLSDIFACITLMQRVNKKSIKLFCEVIFFKFYSYFRGFTISSALEQDKKKMELRLSLLPKFSGLFSWGETATNRHSAYLIF
jgi:hypothetical protein